MKKRGDVRRRLLDVCLRAVIWAGLVFALIPWMLKQYVPKEVLVFNGNVGSLFVVALLVVFAIWRRDAILSRPLRWRPADGVFVLLAVFSFVFSQLVMLSYSANSSYFAKALFVIVPQLLYALGALTLAISVFGIDLFRRESRALKIGALVGIPFVGLSLLFRQLWPVLSDTVLKLNIALLNLTGGVVSSTGGSVPTLGLDGFAVIIGEACSGVDSAIMFTGVYLFIVLLDWRRLNRTALLWLFPIGLLGMFLVNVLRVSFIMMIGAWYSPEFALTLFHENAGWVLFVLFTLGFWYVIYPRVTTTR